LSLTRLPPKRSPQKESSAKIIRTHGGLVHTSRFFFLLFLWHVYPQIPLQLLLSKNPECLCSTLLLFRCGGSSVEGIKNPEGRNGTSGLRLGTSYVPVRRCQSSSMLPLSRCIERSRLVKYAVCTAQEALYATFARRDNQFSQVASRPVARSREDESTVPSKLPGASGGSFPVSDREDNDVRADTTVPTDS